MVNQDSKSEKFIREEMEKYTLNLKDKYWYDEKCNHHTNNSKQGQKQGQKPKKCNILYKEERKRMEYQQVLRSLQDDRDDKDDKDDKTYWNWPFSPVREQHGGYYHKYQKYKDRYKLHTY